MTTLVLDTHVALWVVADPERLGANTRAAIADLDNEVLVSVASVWEAAIKVALGRLRIPDGLWTELESGGVGVTPIERADAVEAGALAPHHRDPFDRMLVAQARRRRATLVTQDSTIAAYDVTVMDARR